MTKNPDQWRSLNRTTGSKVDRAENNCVDTILYGNSDIAVYVPQLPLPGQRIQFYSQQSPALHCQFERPLKSRYLPLHLRPLATDQSLDQWPQVLPDVLCNIFASLDWVPFTSSKINYQGQQSGSAESLLTDWTSVYEQIYSSR